MPLPADIELLHGLVAIPSVNPGEREAVTWLCDRMTRRGFVAHVDGAGNAVGTVGDGSIHIVLLGHIDTVPGQFPVHIAGDLLYGRGSVDAKGPLATFVAATSRAHKQGLLDGLRVTVIGGIGEEAHSPGARYLAETMPAPDACIIGEPGAWESVVLGYKGSMQLRYIRWQPNAHGAGEEKPAPQHAAAAWIAIAAFCENLNTAELREFDRVTPVLRGFSSDTDGLLQRASLNISVRMPPRIEPSELLCGLRDGVVDVPAARISAFQAAVADGYWDDAREAAWEQQWQADRGVANALLVTMEPPMPAFRCEKNTPLVRSLLAGVRAAGGTPRFKVKTGTADMNVVGPAWGCQMAAYGPGDSSLDHTPNEHISLGEYGNAIDALARALGAFAAQARG
jgi:LysW-gamma-L-lysine carboxypeptidase